MVQIIMYDTLLGQIDIWNALALSYMYTSQICI